MTTTLHFLGQEDNAETTVPSQVSLAKAILATFVTDPLSVRRWYTCTVTPHVFVQAHNALPDTLEEFEVWADGKISVGAPVTQEDFDAVRAFIRRGASETLEAFISVD